MPASESGEVKPAALAIVLAVSVLFVFLSLYAHSWGSGGRTYSDPEGYKLLSLMLESEAKSWAAHGLQVSDLQIHNRNIEAFPCTNIPAEFRDAAEDLAKIPPAYFRFARKFTLRFRYSLNGAGDIEITAVGFDSSRSHAVAYVTRGCGAMCSGGYTYLFRNNKETWEIADRVCETMS